MNKICYISIPDFFDQQSHMFFVHYDGINEHMAIPSVWILLKFGLRSHFARDFIQSSDCLCKVHV